MFLQLEEKQIPYTIEKVNMRCYGDKPREFTAKVRPARCSTEGALGSAMTPHFWLATTVYLPADVV